MNNQKHQISREIQNFKENEITGLGGHTLHQETPGTINQTTHPIKNNQETTGTIKNTRAYYAPGHSTTYITFLNVTKQNTCCFPSVMF